MYDLAQFSLSDMVRVTGGVRAAGDGCGNMEEAADRVIAYLHDCLGTKEDGSSNCALVRFYITLSLSDLAPDLQEFAQCAAKPTVLTPETRCLTLLATRGIEPAWNSRKQSVGHQAIPLPSAEAIAQIPMVSQLLRQLGLEVNSLLRPEPAMLVDLEQRTFNVFHVAEALGSPHIPAQAGFVEPYQVKSVLGFGGILPNGELFTLIVFARAPVTRETAEMFRTIALSVKMAVLPFARPGKYFAK